MDKFCWDAKRGVSAGLRAEKKINWGFERPTGVIQNGKNICYPRVPPHALAATTRGLIPNKSPINYLFYHSALGPFSFSFYTYTLLDSSITLTKILTTAMTSATSSLTISKSSSLAAHLSWKVNPSHKGSNWQGKRRMIPVSETNDKWAKALTFLSATTVVPLN